LLDNKGLSEFVKGALQDLSYNQRVNIYDENCPQCPFNLLRVIKGKKVLWEGHNLYDAIEACLDFENSRLLRLCAFGDEEHTTQEIASNTCRLWNKSEHNEGIFIEIDDVKDLKIGITSDLMVALAVEEFANL